MLVLCAAVIPGGGGGGGGSSGPFGGGGGGGGGPCGLPERSLKTIASHLSLYKHTHIYMLYMFITCWVIDCLKMHTFDRNIKQC